MSEDADAAEKREQERLLRTMNKVGGRARASTGGSNTPTRPTSWNVNLTGRAAGSMKRSEQALAFAALQEQIRLEENEKEKEQAKSHSEANKSPTPSPRPASPTNIEDQAEHNAIDAFNEKREMDRINRWTRGLGGKADEKKASVGSATPERPVPAVLLRQFGTEGHKEESNSHNEFKHDEEFNQQVSKLTSNIALAAKAIRQQNREALSKASYSVVINAKHIAELAHDDVDISGWAKALEGSNNMLRTRLDSGGDGHEFVNEISNTLGQLYLSVVSI